MEIIRFRNVSKAYILEDWVIHQLDFSIEKGEFVTLIGPSGCGKTTMLKMINGLIPFDRGDILINGQSIREWDMIRLRRQIGYVIQQIALFPHMTIEKNISYVLDLLKVERETQRKRSEELIDLVGLERSYLKRYPRELSGGQKQRVGVARALAADPEIVLMDEPFGAVDDITRKILQKEMKQLHKMLEKTIVFVTHDIEEAIHLGTKMVLMDQGEIVQAGTKEEMVFSPNNEFTKRFLESKGFNAYLGQLTIKEVCTLVKQKKVSDEIIETIDGDASVLEGIRRLIEKGVKHLNVIGNNGIIGRFSLEDIKEKIKKGE